MEIRRCPRCGRNTFFIKGVYRGYVTGRCQWDSCSYKGPAEQPYIPKPDHLEERWKEALRG